MYLFFYPIVVEGIIPLAGLLWSDGAATGESENTLWHLQMIGRWFDQQKFLFAWLLWFLINGTQVDDAWQRLKLATDAYFLYAIQAPGKNETMGWCSNRLDIVTFLVTALVY